VIWNPVAVVPLSGQPWAALQFAGAVAFVVAGVLVKVPTEQATGDARPARRR
jgi:hypothetical protein